MGQFWQPPSSSILNTASNTEQETTVFSGDSIAAALSQFGLKCEYKAVDLAPQLLTYHFDLINAMQRNAVKRYVLPLSALLRCKVAAVDSNRGFHFAFAVTRPERQKVGFQSVLTNKTYNSIASPFASCIGFDTSNKPVILDIPSLPHMLIAGATGSGKSVALNTLLNTLLFRATPNRLRLLMVDTKKVELSAYEGLPHLYAPIATDKTAAVSLINELVKLMRERQEMLHKQGFTHIDQTNYPHIFLVVDELADLILTAKEEVETALVTLAQLGRNAGIHLILATQRPTVNVVTGLLKANISCRIALQTASIRDSMTILDHKGAEALTGKGDAILKTPDKVEETRLQIAYIDRTDINAITAWWREKALVTA